MKSIKRKGFTLVELLIVIVVIGILSAMMMMSSTEAVTSAKASNIVSNLRNLKTAALAYFTDSMDYVATLTSTPANFSKDIAQYLNAKANINEPGYDAHITSDGEWYVTYEIKGTATEIARIKDKLQGRAKTSGLCNVTGSGTEGSSYAGDSDDYYKGGGVVAMYVR